MKMQHVLKGLMEAEQHTIKALTVAKRKIEIREIVDRLNLSNSTGHDHLKRLSLISQLDIRFLMFLRYKFEPTRFCL